MMARPTTMPTPADAPPPRLGKGPGVNHVAYTWNDLGELVGLYRRLKGYGIVPVRPIKHGLTLSMYYADPDGNLMEFQIDVLEPDPGDSRTAVSYPLRTTGTARLNGLS